MTALAWVAVGLLACLALSVVTALLLRRAARLRDERHAAQWLEYVTRDRVRDQWSR